MENKDQYQQSPEPKYECLLFEAELPTSCYDFQILMTHYPLSSGLSVQITKNIREYMCHKLGMEESTVPELCLSLYKDYGTTMAGLKAQGYKFEYDDFHSFVHGRLPYDLLKPDHVLRGLLLSLPVRKVIFSNGDKNHVAAVLKRLGVEDCVESIICFETLNPTNAADDSAGAEEIEFQGPNTDVEIPRSPVVCKPFKNAYEEAFKIANINPHKTLFFDDSISNLKTAKQVGLETVWVGSFHRTEDVDYALQSIHNMREALPELWAEQSENVRHLREVAIETPVEA